MTTKTISTYIAAGYSLSSAFSRLVITTTGGVGGNGLYVDPTKRSSTTAAFMARAGRMGSFSTPAVSYKTAKPRSPAR